MLNFPTYTANDSPEFFRFGRRLIRNPGYQAMFRILKGGTVFEGSPKDFNFQKQRSNFRALSEILERNDMGFTYIGAETYYPEDWRNQLNQKRGKKLYGLTSFVVIAPKLMWYKYEGATRGGGQNYIYVGSAKMKMTHFLFDLTSEQQNKFIKE